MVSAPTSAPSVSDDFAFRGLVAQVSDPGLWQILDHGELACYLGIDPTGDSLHIGHLLGIVTLRRLQEMGHRPILVAGGGTGRIGDPSGRDDERQLLDGDRIEENLAKIRAQLERLLELAPSGATSHSSGTALLVDNADWLCDLTLVDFLRDVGKHFSVNQMVAKESVRARMDRPDHGISYTEFSYMLLQAYDYLHLYRHYGCTLQVGGSDQWGNITQGLDLIRKFHDGKAHAEAFALTWPLLLRADGEKFGKSSGPAVWLDSARTSPFELYQSLIRVDDREVGQRLRYFTFLSHEEILALDAETELHPERRAAQRALARAVCSLVHGEDETDRAETASAALYSEEVATLDEDLLLAVLADAPSSTVSRERLSGAGADLAELLAESRLSPSRSAARSAISQGGAYVNNRRRGPDEAVVTDADLLHGRYVVLRRGRRDYHLLRFS